ncbi:hypothetical protein E4U55_001401, partial [Claviceps digitariae]
MNAVAAAPRLAARLGRRPWTCSTCRGQTLTAKPSPLLATRSFSSARGSSQGTSGNGGSRSRKIFLFASAGAAGIASTALAFTDEIKNSYDSVERTGRVVAVLAICINDYRTTLNEMAVTEGEDEQNKVLRACHKRCAERTLKAMERNGGIFIKLGQHL